MVLPTGLFIVIRKVSIMPSKSKYSRRRKKFTGKLVRVTGARALATLASQTAIKTALTGAAASGKYRCLTVNASWSIDGLTAGEGPISVGYAHSDYDVAEIKEFLDSQAAIDQGDKLTQEKANRLIRVVGVLSGEANQSLNLGRPIRTRLNWLIGIGDAVEMFAFNEDASAALTTGANVHCIGKMHIKDSA